MSGWPGEGELMKVVEPQSLAFQIEACGCQLPRPAGHIGLHETECRSRQVFGMQADGNTPIADHDIGIIASVSRR